MKQSKEKEFIYFFREIDKYLAKENLAKKVPLYVFGGAAVVIAYGSKRGTLDIDAYIENRAIKGRLLGWAGQGSELEKKYGLYLHYANTELMLIETPEWKERSVEILRGKLKHVQVRALGKEDLILGKLSRYNDRDREDIHVSTASSRIGQLSIMSPEFMKRCPAVFAAATLKPPTVPAAQLYLKSLSPVRP